MGLIETEHGSCQTVDGLMSELRDYPPQALVKVIFHDNKQPNDRMIYKSSEACDGSEVYLYAGANLKAVRNSENRRMYIYANCLRGECLSFIGKYLRDLETKNWHCYLREDGDIIHVKKDGSLIVIGGTEEEVRQSQLNPDGFSE